MNAIQRVALLGGGGFIGSWLTERLTETGKETVILTRRPDHAASARIFPTAEIVGVDACDTDALSQLPPAEAAALREGIERLLALDAEIRSHADPFLSSVRKLLTTERQARAVRSAYGALAP